jgi:hypothetical protein
MTKVGLPGAKEGWQKTDVTMATVLKSQGYATGQFGKNHQGDRDEHLPTQHGFDEFFGNLHHLLTVDIRYPRRTTVASGQVILRRLAKGGHLPCLPRGQEKPQDIANVTPGKMKVLAANSSHLSEHIPNCSHSPGAGRFNRNRRG